MSSILRRTSSWSFVFETSYKQYSSSSILNRGFPKIGFFKRNLSQTPALMKELTDPLELATGIAKRELLLKAAGCQDPWGMTKPLKRGSGKANDPTQIPSAFEGRVVGCVCLGDRFIKWMWLEKGCPKRCECGHHFVLKHVPPI